MTANLVQPTLALTEGVDMNHLEMARLYRDLHTDSDASLDRVAALAAALFRMPMACVSYLDAHHVWFKSRRGFDVPMIERDEALRLATLESGEILANSGQPSGSLPSFTSFVRSLNVHFLDGAPLVTSKGMHVGMLLLMDVRPRVFTGSERQSLTHLAALMMEQLELRRISDEQQDSADGLAIFANSPVGYYRTLPSGEILTANRAILDLLGYDSMEELQQRNLEEEHLVETRSLWRAKLEAAGQITGYESVWYARDGRSVEIRESTRVVKSQDGKIAFYEGWAEDISRRKAAEASALAKEERWQLALAANNDGLWDWNVVTNEVFHSVRWKGILGYDPEDSVDWETMLHPEDAPRVTKYLERYLAREIPLYQQEYRMRAKDGSYRWVLARGIAHWDAAGNLLRMVGSHSDITERKQDEEVLRLQTGALARAKEKAEAAVVAKSNFLATMSHEIRTPLNGIIGMTDIMAHSELDSDQRDYLETIRSSGESLLSIINDILDFSKIESGKMELEQVDFNIWAVVEEAVALVAPAAHAKQLELISPIDPSVPSSVRGDSKRLRQVLLNLLGNAIKFTHIGDVVLRLSVLSLDRETASLRFEISDTGIGIPEPVRARIFEPFTQADASTTRRFGGTGLGLAISRQLVNLMGGEIMVESEPGRGSTFSFTVPLAISTVPEPQPDEDNVILQGRRVLVVDDNSTNRKLLERLLTAYQIQITSAEDGMQALKMLLEARKDDRPFDLALLDLQMPLMDGVMLAKAIRAQQEFESLPLILLTSVSGVDSAYSVNGLRIHSTLAKPVRRIPLLQEMRSALGAAHTKATPKKQLPGAAAESRGHLLLAEDNLVNQKVCGVILKRLGYTFDVVGNGSEAFQAIQKHTYDAVLLDCQMPEMDGFEAARAIRNLEAGGPRLPLIALTANALPGERQKCLDAGMDDYLSKPIRPESLSTTLQVWVKSEPTSVVSLSANLATD